MANDILIEAKGITRILPRIVPTTLMPSIDLAIRELGFVFQFHFLLSEFTAQENVMLPMRTLACLSSEEMRARAADLLDKLGLAEHRRKRPALSPIFH